MKRLGELDNIQRLYEIKENVMKSQKDMTKQFNDSVIVLRPSQLDLQLT